MLTHEPARPEDVECIFRLNKGLIDRYEDTAAIDYEKVLLWVQRNITHALPWFRRILWKDTLVGYFCLTPEGELDSLFVLPDFQGQGIGTQVIQHCQAHRDSLFLYVFRKNSGAVKLYQRMGFQITREVGTTRYIMEYK